MSSISAPSSQEIFSFSFGGSTDNLLAFGCNSQLLMGGMGDDGMGDIEDSDDEGKDVISLF